MKLDSMGNLLWATEPDYGTDGAVAYDLTLYNNEVAIAAAHTLTTPWGALTYNHPSSNRQPLVVRFDQSTGATLSIDDIRGFTTANEATAIAVDQYGNYTVGGYFTDSLFLSSGNTPNVNMLSRRAGGNTDFFYGSLNRTDCNGVPLSGISVENQIKIGLYPNPSQGSLVHVTGLEMATIYTIYDMAGRSIQSGTVEQNASLDISRLSAGSYLIALKNNHQNAQLRLIKK
jgi:hypothetical protein